MQTPSDLTSAPAKAPQPVLIPVVLVALLCLPMIVLSQLAAHWRFDVVDDQMFGYFGWRIAHGGTVYLDVWDNKPPGIYWLNAIGFLLGADTYWGVIALCFTALVLVHILFFCICASVYFRGSAAVATVLLSFFITHTYYQGGANRTETFLVLFELAGALTYLRGFHRRRGWQWWLAGVFCGVAFLFKQVGLAAWGAMGVHTIVLMCTREISISEGIKRGALLTLGVGTVCAAAAGYLASQGALEAACFATFGFNRGYFAVGASSFNDTWLNRHMLMNHLMPILRLPVLMAIAALVHAVIWRLKPEYRPPEIVSRLDAWRPVAPRSMLFFTTWAAAAFYGACVSPHHFRHYLIPFIPPLMLMAGYIVNVLKTEISLLRRLAQRGSVVAWFVFMGWLALDAANRQWEGVATVWYDRLRFRLSGPMLPTPWEQIADEVAQRTTPDQKIQCWGYLPGVYLHARRINACRFITTEKIGHVGDNADFVRRELRQTLESDPPAMIVMPMNDYTWITEPESHREPRDWLGEWMAGWLDPHYARVLEISNEENVLLFQRRDLAPASQPPSAP